MKTKSPKFKVGQVVRINTEFYNKGARRNQQYQRITRVWNWQKGTRFPFGYTLLNKDECNERFLEPLTKRELGE